MRAQLPWLCLLVRRDLEFLADAGRGELDVDRIVGERFEQVVNELFGLNAKAVAKLRERLR
jgi:hypothetical protein